MTDEQPVPKPQGEFDLDEMLEYEKHRQEVNAKAIGTPKPQGHENVGVV